MAKLEAQEGLRPIAVVAEQRNNPKNQGVRAAAMPRTGDGSVATIGAVAVVVSILRRGRSSGGRPFTLAIGHHQQQGAPTRLVRKACNSHTEADLTECPSRGVVVHLFSLPPQQNLRFFA